MEEERNYEKEAEALRTLIFGIKGILEQPRSANLRLNAVVSLISDCEHNWPIVFHKPNKNVTPLAETVAAEEHHHRTSG